MFSNAPLLRLSLKVWNYAMGVGGIATILYAIFMFRAGGETSSSSHHVTIPWFFHAFLFVGIMLCAVTCLGHMAAHTANTCCLSTAICVLLAALSIHITNGVDGHDSEYEYDEPRLALLDPLADRWQQAERNIV